MSARTETIKTYRVAGGALLAGDRLDDPHLPFCTVVSVDQITDGWLITTDLTGAWHTIVIGPDEYLRVVA